MKMNFIIISSFLLSTLIFTACESKGTGNEGVNSFSTNVSQGIGNMHGMLSGNQTLKMDDLSKKFIIQNMVPFFFGNKINYDYETNFLQTWPSGENQIVLQIASVGMNQVTEGSYFVLYKSNKEDKWEQLSSGYPEDGMEIPIKKSLNPKMIEIRCNFKPNSSGRIEVNYKIIYPAHENTFCYLKISGKAKKTIKVSIVFIN